MWPYAVIAQAPPDGGGWFVQLLPLILIFGIFWLLVIRPQRQRQKEHQAFLGAIKKGDKVVTAGGVFGTVEKVGGQVIDLRVSRDTRLKVLRQQIEGAQSDYLADEEDEDKEEEEDDS
jgi:preprotein translocase subunit YajC